MVPSICVAVDVDVGKVVVGANLLNLAQRVLQRMPVPEANVLQSGLVVGWIGCADGGLGGKLALREAVEAICLAGHLDVVGDVGLLADKFVGLDDEAADIPADHADRDITDHGRQRWQQRASARAA